MASFKDLFIKPPEGGEKKGAPPTTRQTVRAPQGAVPRPASDVPPPTRTLLKTGGPTLSPAKPSVPHASRTPDPQFLAEIDEALQRATNPGYDELLAQMDVLRDAVPPEKLVAVSVKSVTKAHGISSQQLIAAVEERLRILGDVQADTESQLADEAQKSVEASRQAVEDANKRIETIDAQIARLQQERVNAERSAETAQQQIDSIHGEVADVKARFVSAYNLRVGELTQALQDLRGSITPIASA